MIHSIKTTYVLMLAVALFFCGCSQEADTDVADMSDAASQDLATVVLRLKTNTSVMSVVRSVEDSYSHVQGTAEEYQVNNVQVYFFDSATKLFVKSFALTGIKRAGSDASGNIVYESDRVSVPQGIFDIFVTANTDRQINKNTEAAFLADIDSTTYVRGLIDDISQGIVMTNRASDNSRTVIMKRAENADNVVTITLERVLARLDIAKGAESFQLTEPDGKQYATVTLEGFSIVNLPKYYYSYRHTAVLTSLTEPEWSIDEHFGRVNDVNGYVVDPYFFKKQAAATGFNNADKYYEHFYGDYGNPDAVSWSAFKAVAQTPQYVTAYCAENCMLAPAQKNGYSTGVVFKASLVPHHNVYHLGTDGQLQLTAESAPLPNVLYYYDYKFYDSAEALAAAVGVASVSGASLDMFMARKYEKSDTGFHCYYTYWIRHLDNNRPTEMGVMEFGVVRNNLYRMLVTNVSGLGYQDILPDPDVPDEGETNLKVILNVKPWIVRDLTNIVL